MADRLANLRMKLDACEVARVKAEGENAAWKAALAEAMEAQQPPPPPPPPPPVLPPNPPSGTRFMPPATWRPYSPDSPFNKPMAHVPKAGGQAIIDGFDFSGFMKMVAGDWSHPLYFSLPSDPEFTIRLTQPWGANPFAGRKFRIPDKAKAAGPLKSVDGNTDAHLCVVDPVSGVEVDLWQVHTKPAGGGEIVASWGSLGNLNGTGLGIAATAALFGLPLGMIRANELAAGAINHALFITIPHDNGSYVYPAGKTGSSSPGIGIPPMGQGFYLDMSVAEIDARSIPEWKKVMLRCMSIYGMYFGDTGGGSAPHVFAEARESHTSFGLSNPWVELVPKCAGASTWENSAIFPFYDALSPTEWKSRMKARA